MSPRFGMEKVMRAALAAGVVGAAIIPDEAEAGGYSEKSREMAAHADTVLETQYPGYTFEVIQNTLAINPDYTIQVSRDGSTEKPQTTRIKPPTGLSGAALDGYLKQEMGKILTPDSSPNHGGIESVVESMNITSAGADLIREMGGDPTPHLTTGDRGELVVSIKLSDAAKDSYVRFDANTASAWVGPGYDNAGHQVLQIKITNEDGSQESAYWNLDGNYGG